MGRVLNLALVGADEPLGDALLRELEERELELAGLWPVSLAEDEGGTVDHAGRRIACLDLDGVDYGRVNAVVLASPQARPGELLERLGGRDIPLWGPRAWLDRDAESDGRVRPLPDAPAIALTRALAPVGHTSGLVSVHAFVTLPVAALGEAGIRELADQTRALFALDTPEAEALPVRIAFNLLPSSPGAGPDREAALADQLRGALAGESQGKSGVPYVQVSLAWAPIFHGAAAMLHLRARRALDPAGLRALWEGVDGLAVMDEPLPGGVPTPATEGLDSATVFVGRLAVDPDDPTRVSCWLCFDHPRLEAAWIADQLVKTD